MTAPYAEGTWTEVSEVLRREQLDYIEVSTGLPMGPMGPMGPEGPQGPRGGSVWHHGEGVPTVTGDPVLGDFYLDTASGDVYEYVLGSDGYAYWRFLFTIVSATGPTGPTGSGGPTGQEGEPGHDGAMGPMPLLVAGEVHSVDYGQQPLVGFTQTGDGFVVNYTLVSGPTGPAGTGITIQGSVATSGFLPGSGNTPGDGWVTQDTGHVWVWTPSGSWVNVGPVVGPVGPMGPGFVSDMYPLDLLLSPSGEIAYQEITHTLDDPFPLVRILVPEGATGYLTDSLSVQVFYNPGTRRLRVETDPSTRLWNPPPTGMGGGKVLVTGGGGGSSSNPVRRVGRL